MPLSNEQWNAPSAGGDFYEHQIANSCRFKSATSDSLSLTFGTSTDLSKFTFSCWVKRSLTYAGGQNTTWQNIIGRGTTIAGGGAAFGFESGGGTSGGLNNRDRIAWYGLAGDGGGSTGGDDRIAGYYYDTSAWYHIVVRVDTSQSAATKIRYYVNGDLKVRTSTNEPTGDMNRFNTAAAHFIGADVNGAFDLDAYLAEVVFCDGQSLGPGSFGETKNGAWIPSDPSGLTFGNNGFYLKFANASALGADSSGNGNNWTVNNITAHDQMLDTPTFGEDNGGNFATLNPLAGSAENILTEGNLKATKETGSYNECTPATMNLKGKYYLECCAKELLAQNLAAIGLVNVSEDLTNGGRDSRMDLTGVSYSESGELQTAGNRASFGDAWEAGDIIQMAVDMTNINSVKVWFGNNNTWQNSGDPAAGSGEAATITNGEQIMAMSAGYSGTGELVFNFGQEGTFAGEKTAGGNADANGYGNFIYAPPTNFLALCTGNLTVADEIDPAQTDDDFPQKLFSTTLYTGNDTTNNITGVGFQPDLLLFKIRSTASSGMWVDTNRARTTASYSITNDAEVTIANITAIGSDGFSLDGTSDYKPNFNNNTHTYVAWAWRANGGSTSTNSTGSVNVTQQVDPSGSFSISTYGGAGGTGTIGHGLSRPPTFVIIKQRNAANNWAVYAKGAANTNYAYLDTDAAFGDATMWQDTTPSSSLVYLGDNNEVNHSGRTYVAYCFADTEGYIKSGTYEGSGAADGAFVYTGFRPALIITKSVDSTSNWQVFDDKREGYNVDNDELYINIHDAEATTDMIDIFSNGFKCRIATDPNVAETYIYLAFAHNPLKYATAR
jgi:hypothetical protein